MYICKECGKTTERDYGGMCQGCYVYFKNGGTVNPLPEHGRITYDENGKVVCHICGRAYTRLGSHAREFHNITIDEYKEQFGLCKNAKTTEKKYASMMQRYAKINGMPERLAKAGTETRIKKGENRLRKNKKVRLQEILEKQDRNKNK